MNALYLPTLFKCSFSNLFEWIKSQNQPRKGILYMSCDCNLCCCYLKKFHIPRRIISRLATTATIVCLCMKEKLKSRTVCSHANLSKMFKICTFVWRSVFCYEIQTLISLFYIICAHHRDEVHFLLRHKEFIPEPAVLRCPV